VVEVAPPGPGAAAGEAAAPVASADEAVGVGVGPVGERLPRPADRVSSADRGGVGEREQRAGQGMGDGDLWPGGKGSVGDPPGEQEVSQRSASRGIGVHTTGRWNAVDLGVGPTVGGGLDRTGARLVGGDSSVGCPCRHAGGSGEQAQDVGDLPDDLGRQWIAVDLAGLVAAQQRRRCRGDRELGLYRR
jgi:hypothetical protein